jgi:hypothetical protein
VVGVERGGIARANPLGIMDRNVIVNDRLPVASDPEPLLMTYRPSCGSSLTAIRRFDGTAVRFEVSHCL